MSEFVSVSKAKSGKMTHQSSPSLTFEIAMLDVVMVEVVEPLQHLLEDVAGIRLDKLPPRPGLHLGQLLHTAISLV